MGQAMKLEPAVTYYGTQRKLAESLDIHESQVSRWVKGGIIPIKYALKLVALSRGELALNLRDY